MSEKLDPEEVKEITRRIFGKISKALGERQSRRKSLFPGRAGQHPDIAMKRDMEPLHKAAERYAGTVDISDSKLATLKEKIAQL